jgi:anti-sigma regulatory factor (Ser/Thr protein kinase)
VTCARLHAGEVLREWGLSALVEDAELIVSELMTNAVKAAAALPGRPPVAVRLLVSVTVLLIEARDQTPLDPQPQAEDAEAEGGRGLMIVAALSRRWGCERAGDQHKVVWAELAL